MINTEKYNHSTLHKKFNSLLEALGWNISGKIPDIAEIWKKSIKNKRFEVILPVSYYVDDWYIAFEKALKTICESQNWNYLEVKDYILSNRLTNETISLRAFGSLCVNNTLPISYGNDLHINFSKIIKNTAKQYFSKNKLHKSDRNQKNDYAKNF